MIAPITRFAIVAFEGDTVVTLPETAFTERQRAAIRHVVANRGIDTAPPAEREPDPPRPSPTDRIAQASAARAKGYTGEFCPQCQSPNTRRNGSCLVCDTCGSTTGCS